MKKSERKAIEAAKVAALAKADKTKSTTPKVEDKLKSKKEVPAPPIVAGKEKELNGKTAEGTVKAITEKKDLKYIYPEDIDTLDTRKTFRATVRRKMKAFMKDASRLQAAVEEKGLKADKTLLKAKYAEIDSYAKEVLVNPSKVS